jgi:pyridinium-3,5-bisthiocarboxylic acid mononucleotide nickel chelatase
MRIGYLECFSGISGDMLLGALVDAGVPFARLEETAAALNVGARLEMRKVSRGGWPQPRWTCLRPDRPVNRNEKGRTHA